MKQEHKDSIEILKNQAIEYKGEIDNHLNQLEITWRRKEYESIQAKIEYLRYKQVKLEQLGACLFSKSSTLT